MANLVVLSEIDCLDLLKRKGIYPSRFYTDFETFKNHSPIFDDVIVVCIFAGTCAFSKRRVLEAMMNLRKRANEDPESIKGVYILSDTILSGCKSYYLYRSIPLSVSKYSGFRCVSGVIKFWERLSYDKCSESNIKTFYSDYDKGSSKELIKKLEERYKETDELIPLIKIPEIVTVSE